MRDSSMMGMGMAKPGRAILGMMGLLLGIWIFFAIAINFAGADDALYLAFAGNTKAILHGQIWRLFTAGLVHLPSGSGSVQHILFALVGFYFLAPSLELVWGAARFVAFVAGSMIFAFTVQLLVEWIAPAVGLGAIVQPYWFGAYGAIEAIAVAWALSNRGQSVRLFFVIPVTATGLLVFIGALSFLRILAADKPLEGLMTPFGGMLAGYLFGAGTPTPARRVLLKIRYQWLARRGERYRTSRASAPHLRVIDGGRQGERHNGASPDKRTLN